MKKKTRTLNVKISPDEIRKISAGIDIQIVKVRRKKRP